VKKSGVTVSALCPGITETNMVKTLRNVNQKVAGMPDFLIGDVKDVARKGYEACVRGRVVEVPGAVNQASMLMSRSMPKKLLRRVAGILGRQSF